MGDATKEVAQSLADELEIVRALSSCGRFGIMGRAHECARAVWVKVYHALRPPLDLAAMRYVHRHHVQLLEPADAVSDILASFQASVMDPDGPTISGRRRRHRGHAGQTGAASVEKGPRKETRRGDVAFSSRHDRDRKAGQGFAEVDSADLRDFLDRTVAARVGRNGATCLHLADDGCSLEEMGKQLGISRATAQRRLAEARAVAKAYLQAENLAPPGK